MASGGIIATFYNRKNKDKTDSVPLYSFIRLSTIFIVWLIMFIFDGQVNAKVVPYALLMAVCYTTSSIANVYAIKERYFENNHWCGFSIMLGFGVKSIYKK